jgi:2'-5' RNA ligase
MNPYTKRTFIAYRVNAGKEILDCLGQLRRSLKEEKIRWVDPASMHITLTFIGDTAEQQAIEIGKIMERYVPRYSPPEIIIQGMGIFRSISKPRVIWLGINPIPELEDLKTEIDRELGQIGLSVEKRPFRPHLTLGRVRWLNDKLRLADLVNEYHGKLFQNDEIDELVLLESVLRPEGPLYLPLKRVRFKYDGP